MKTKPTPLYEKDGNEVWDAKEYLRPVVMTSGQHFWLVIGAMVVSAIVFVIILFVVKNI